MEKTVTLRERPREHTCKDCAFFGILDHVTPICRFEPPKVLPIMPRPAGDGWISTVAWPDVSPDTDWCGRFQLHPQLIEESMRKIEEKLANQVPGSITYNRV